MTDLHLDDLFHHLLKVSFDTGDDVVMIDISVISQFDDQTFARDGHNIKSVICLFFGVNFFKDKTSTAFAACLKCTLIKLRNFRKSGYDPAALF